MRVLILGGNGMLGHKLLQVFDKNFDTFGTVRNSKIDFESEKIIKNSKIINNVDALNIKQINNLLEELQPNVIVNAIGVIKQKKDSKDVLNNIEINALLPHKIAHIANGVGARFINISTDCVFDGQKGMYVEDDLPNAIDVYGKTKYLGEVIRENCLTIRTSIIGRELETSNGLVEWFLSNKGNKIKGYKNAIFSGFPTITLANILTDIINKQKNLHGLFHISSKPINKYDLLNLIKSKLDYDIEIEQFDGFYIDRSLDSSKFRTQTGYQPDKWEYMIDEMLDDPKPYISAS